jgi:hypothetical protein
VDITGDGCSALVDGWICGLFKTAYEVLQFNHIHASLWKRRQFIHISDNQLM